MKAELVAKLRRAPSMRLLLLPAALLSLGACSSPVYTIQAATPIEGSERAARYCYLRDATARLEGTVKRDGKSIEIYRCVPGAEPAHVIAGTTY